MEDLSGWGPETEIASITVGAREVGEALSVSADARVRVGLVVVSGRQHDLGIVVPLETGPWDDVEDAVCAITVRRVVAAAQRFELVHVLRIELRPHVTRN